MNRRFDRLIRGAQFRYQASIEELQHSRARGLDKSIITRLATGDYIKKGESVLVTGAIGCGKSFLASALGHHACTQGFKVQYHNVQKLFLKMKMARVDGSIFRSLDKLNQTDLLILDDFGLTQTGAAATIYFFISDRGQAFKKGYHHIQSATGGQLLSGNRR